MTGMAHDPEQEQPKVLEIDLRQLTRRQMLSLLGVGAGAAALAACGGTTATTTSGGGTTASVAPTTAAAGGGTTASTAPSASAAGSGTTASAAPTTAAAGGGKRGGQINGGTNLLLPPTGHHNFFLPSNAIGTDFWAELEQLTPAWYLWQEDKYVPLLAEKWGFEGAETFSMTLKPNLKWSNGQPLTTKDVLVTANLRRLYNDQMFKYVDRIDVKDERTITFHMSVPSTVVERYVLRGTGGGAASGRIRPYSIWGAIGDKLTPLYAAGKDNTSEEVKAVRKEADDLRPTERLASGPYIMDLKTLTEASVEYAKNPTGLGADTARFDKIKLYVGETPVSTPLVLQKEMDFATNGYAVATDQQMKSTGIRVLRTPTHFGPAICFNFANAKLKVFGDKRVRQAIAHAVKRDDNGIVSLGESGKAVKYMSGVTDGVTERWMSKDDLGKLNQYPYDQKKAADLLIAAGCKKQGDQWLDPDGKPMAYELIEPAEYQDWSASAQDWAEQMTKFGIKITVRAITFTQLPIERREGRFEMAIDGWGTGNPHPHFQLVTTLLSKVQPLANGPYISFDLKQKTDVAGDVDFQALITSAAQGLDVNVQKTNAGKAMLAFNELLPVVPLWERYGNGPALEGVRVEKWPADSDPLYQNTLYNDAFITQMIYNGTLGPK